MPAEPPDDGYRDHVGIHPQKQAGYVYAGMSVLRGCLTVEQMRAAATEVPAAIERLLNAYLAERRDGQTFRDVTARHTDEELRELLAGAPVGPVARDTSPGRPPHGVDA